MGPQQTVWHGANLLLTSVTEACGNACDGGPRLIIDENRHLVKCRAGTFDDGLFVKAAETRYNSAKYYFGGMAQWRKLS
jgi:hypothetical protein